MNSPKPPVLAETPPWTTAGGDSTRRGSSGQPAAHRLRLVRTLRAAGAVQASVVFDRAGTAFVADMAGGLQAFTTEGRRAWQTSLGGGISATPVVHPDRPWLCAATQRGSVYALHSGDGSILWRREMPTRSDPRVLSDLLFLPQPESIVLSSWGGRFRALDAVTGEERFTWDAGFYPGAAAAADPDGRVYCLRAAPGEGVELLRVAIGAGEVTVLHRRAPGARGERRALVAAAPVLDPERGVLYAILNDDQRGRLIAWSLAAQAVVWERPFEHCVQATPAVRRDGTVVVAELGPSVHGVGTDGSDRFRYRGDSEYWLASPVTEVGGSVLVGDPLGALHRINPTGQGTRVFEAPRSLQARGSFDAAGRFYLPSTDHRVYVFGG